MLLERDINRLTSITAYHWVDHDHFEALTAFLRLLLDKGSKFAEFSIAEDYMDDESIEIGRKDDSYRKGTDIKTERELLELLRSFKEKFDEHADLHNKPYNFWCHFLVRLPLFHTANGTLSSQSVISGTESAKAIKFNHGSNVLAIYKKSRWGDWAKRNVDRYIDLFLDITRIYPEGDIGPMAFIRPVWRFIPLKDFDACVQPLKTVEGVHSSHAILQRLRESVPKEPILEILQSNSIEFKELPDDRVYVRFGETLDDLQYDYRTVFRDVKKAVLPDLKEVGLR